MHGFLAPDSLRAFQVRAAPCVCAARIRRQALHDRGLCHGIPCSTVRVCMAAWPVVRSAHRKSWRCRAFAQREPLAKPFTADFGSDLRECAARGPGSCKQGPAAWACGPCKAQAAGGGRARETVSCELFLAAIARADK